METVILPHGNELKKLRTFQQELCRTLTHALTEEFETTPARERPEATERGDADATRKNAAQRDGAGAFCVPCFPLVVRMGQWGMPGERADCAALARQISTIYIEEIETDMRAEPQQNGAVLAVSLGVAVQRGGETVHGRIELAHVHNAPPALCAKISGRAIAAQPPATLPVFRVAHLTVTRTEILERWEITGGRWAKPPKLPPQAHGRTDSTRR